MGKLHVNVKTTGTTTTTYNLPDYVVRIVLHTVENTYHELYSRGNVMPD